MCPSEDGTLLFAVPCCQPPLRFMIAWTMSRCTPESALAAFADREHKRGYQQFEAIGYQNGADGKPHTADDVELGPVDVTWSLEVFYRTGGNSTDFVGMVSCNGPFYTSQRQPQE